MSGDEEQLEVSRVIDASPQRVFDAWTDPEMIVRWWGAGPVRCTAAELDLSVGGTYRIANQTPDGATMWITGEFSLIDAPNQLAYSWALEPVDADTDVSLVEVSFEEAKGGTLVSIRHTRISNVASRDMNLQGWVGCLDGLNSLLTSGDSPA